MTEEAKKLKQQDHRRYINAYWDRRCKETGKTRSQLRREDEDARYERKAAAALEAAARKQKRLTVEFDPDVQDISVSVSRGKKTDEAYIEALEMANKTYHKENRRLQKLLTQYQEIIRIGTNQYMRDKQKQDKTK